MEFFSYLETDGQCWFDTGVIPDINTRVEAAITPLAGNPGGAVFYGSSETDISSDCFVLRMISEDLQHFNVMLGNYFPSSVYLPAFAFTAGTAYYTTLDKNAFTKDSESFDLDVTAFTTSQRSIYVGGRNKGGSVDPDTKSKARFGYLKIYQNGVMVANLLPAEVNGYLGFLDVVQGVFHTNLGTGTPVAGQSLGSIVMIADKDFLPASGGTATFKVYTDNAWSVATAENWFTVSTTGGTGSGTFTVTAPNYTGTTARTDVVTATDSVTSDFTFISLTQKKYKSGQPLYLGADEITEIYLGADKISEAYLGTDLVYSAGPFIGLKTTPKALSFNPYLLSTTLKVKCSEQWSMTLPNWLTADTLTGDTGETIVSLTATTQQAATSSTITITSANYSTGVTADFSLYEQVKCIYSAGTVDMRFNTGVDLVWVYTGQINGSDGSVLLGATGVPDRDDYRFFATGPTTNYFDIGDGRQYGSWIGSFGLDLEMECGNYYVKVNGEQKISTVRQATAPVAPFCVNTDKIKMYSLAATDGGTPVADIIPVKTGTNLYFLNRTTGTQIAVTNPNAQYEPL